MFSLVEINPAVLKEKMLKSLKTCAQLPTSRHMTSELRWAKKMEAPGTNICIVDKFKNPYCLKDNRTDHKTSSKSSFPRLLVKSSILMKFSRGTYKTMNNFFLSVFILFDCVISLCFFLLINNIMEDKKNCWKKKSTGSEAHLK